VNLDKAFTPPIEGNSKQRQSRVWGEGKLLRERKMEVWKNKHGKQKGDRYGDEKEAAGWALGVKKSK